MTYLFGISESMKLHENDMLGIEHEGIIRGISLDLKSVAVDYDHVLCYYFVPFAYSQSALLHFLGNLSISFILVSVFWVPH